MEKRYIQTFETGESLQEALDNNELGKPYVAYLEDEQRIDWNTLTPTPPDPYLSMPLTFEITGDGNIKWSTGGAGTLIKTIEYKLNDGEWASITSSYDGENIPVVAGDIVQFRGDNDYYCTNLIYCGFFGSTATFKIYGNIMSLLYSTDFETATTFPGDETTVPFARFFSGINGLTDASNLKLPATTLKNSCYKGMFYSCAGLTQAPELPATVMVDGCYTELFFRCSNLNYIKCLATDISASLCLNNWVAGVSPTGTFVKNPNMSSWTTGYSGIPTGWTVQDATI